MLTVVWIMTISARRKFNSNCCTSCSSTITQGVTGQRQRMHEIVATISWVVSNDAVQANVAATSDNDNHMLKGVVRPGIHCA